MRSSQYQQYHDGPAVSKSCSVKLNQWCRCHLSLVGREDPSSFTVCSYRLNLQQFCLIVIRESQLTLYFGFFLFNKKKRKGYTETDIGNLPNKTGLSLHSPNTSRRETQPGFLKFSLQLQSLDRGKLLGRICGYLAVCLGRKSLIEYQSTSNNYIFYYVPALKAATLRGESQGHNSFFKA